MKYRRLQEGNERRDVNKVRMEVRLMPLVAEKERDKPSIVVMFWGARDKDVTCWLQVRVSLRSSDGNQGYTPM